MVVTCDVPVLALRASVSLVRAQQVDQAWAENESRPAVEQVRQFRVYEAAALVVRNARAPAGVARPPRLAIAPVFESVEQVDQNSGLGQRSAGPSVYEAAVELQDGRRDRQRR